MVQDAVANEMRRMFLSADKWFYPINGPSEGSVMLENLTRRDLVVMLSLSGESRTIVELAHAVKVRNVPLVSITQLRDNTLAQISDPALHHHHIHPAAEAAASLPADDLLLYPD